ncbi:MAG: tetratricopeptide repeat protein, partial [Pseudobdellovibrionaceae bacterium]
GQAYSDNTPDTAAWAVNLLERAASQQYPPAMRTLAYALRDGIGIAQNPQRAILLFSEAAELGDVPSQASLGTMFFNGAGTQRDVLRALFWYYEAQKNNYEGKLGKHIAQASALIGRPELTPATPFTALINRARAGSAQAAFELYSQHAQTIAPISNFYEGGYWLRKSANSSYQPAQAAFPELIATCRETQKSLEDLSSDKSCMILNGAGYNFKNGKWKTN